MIKGSYLDGESISSCECLGMKFKYFTNDCMASNSIGLNQEWESHITKFVRIFNSLYKIINIVDIGANFGYHTLLFSSLCSGNVYAFEPQIQNYELLEENIKINKIKNAKIYNYACGDEKCEIKLPICNLKRIINMGDITPNLKYKYNNNYSVTKSIILDDILLSSKIDLIKLDVQGWEKKVLIGSLNILKTHKPVLIVEFENDQLKKTNTNCKELFEFIRNQDYYIFYLEYVYPSDHVCVHNDNLIEFRSKFKNYIFTHTTNNTINDNLINNVHEKIVV